MAAGRSFLPSFHASQPISPHYLFPRPSAFQSLQSSALIYYKAPRPQSHTIRAFPSSRHSSTVCSFPYRQSTYLLLSVNPEPYKLLPCCSPISPSIMHTFRPFLVSLFSLFLSPVKPCRSTAASHRRPTTHTSNAPLPLSRPRYRGFPSLYPRSAGCQSLLAFFSAGWQISTGLNRRHRLLLYYKKGRRGPRKAGRVDPLGTTYVGSRSI